MGKIWETDAPVLIIDIWKTDGFPGKVFINCGLSWIFHIIPYRYDNPYHSVPVYDNPWNFPYHSMTFHCWWSFLSWIFHIYVRLVPGRKTISASASACAAISAPSAGASSLPRPSVGSCSAGAARWLDLDLEMVERCPNSGYFNREIDDWPVWT